MEYLRDAVLDIESYLDAVKYLKVGVILSKEEKAAIDEEYAKFEHIKDRLELLIKDLEHEGF